MKVIRLEETESTNSYAKLHIDDFEDKTVIHALRQTNGRGRLNRSWVDLGEGNLFITIILKPSSEFNQSYANITQYTSVILCRTFEKYGIIPKIKWPNDVMIDGNRKISGILSETVLNGKELKGIVVGIGVNLNSDNESVSKIKDRVVTALNIETGCKIDMNKFLDEFLGEFFMCYDEFIISGFDYICDEYVKRNCFVNKQLDVQVLNERLNGFAKGITPTGELILQTKDKDLVLTIGDIL